MLIGSFSVKTVGHARSIDIVNYPNHQVVARLVIVCTGHQVGSVFCEDAAGGPFIHPPPFRVLDKGDTYHLGPPILCPWVHHPVDPFYSIVLPWRRDYYMDLAPNLRFQYRRPVNPRHPNVQLPVFHFERLSLVTQIQVAARALVQSMYPPRLMMSYLNTPKFFFKLHN
jgi:hypothetical protein